MRHVHAHDTCAGHKGRYLSYGALCLGIGSLTCTVPQWISAAYQYEVTGDSAQATCVNHTNV